MKRTLAALGCLALGLALAACGSSSSSPSGVTALQVVDLTVGGGATAAAGDTLTVAYVGSLTNGRTFDSSTGYTFRLGVGAVIPGWDQGLVGMRVGGKRRLTIPPDLAYGSTGAGNVIPPNATLIFEVDLLSIAGK